MADSSERKNNDNEFNLEDLTQIEGIGKVKQLWLKSMGIDTIQALADASAEALHRQLTSDGHVAHTSEVERWIVQAKTLLGRTDVVSETSASVTPAEDVEGFSEAVMQSSSEDAAASEQLPLEQSSLEQPVEDWQTFAAFTVEFQSWGSGEQDVQRRTLVRHVATDREEIWSGIEASDLQAWLRSQVADVMPATEAADSINLPSVEDAAESIDTPVTPVIEDLYVLQPLVADTAMGLYKPSMLFPAPLKGNFPFSLALKFGIPEQSVVARLKHALSYQVECYARSHSGGDIISLGELPKTKLLPQKSSYTAYLPTTRLKKGLYRLQVFLNLEGAQALPTFLEVPVLQVV